MLAGILIIIIIDILIVAIPAGLLSAFLKVTDKKSSPKTIVSTPDFVKEGTVWIEPRNDNMWDSFDFFIRLGELVSKHETTVVTLSLQTESKQGKEKGSFEISFFDEERAHFYDERIPYLKYLTIPYRGCDPTTTGLTMTEDTYRNLITNDAPHAERITYQKYPDGLLIVSVKYAEHK